MLPMGGETIPDEAPHSSQISIYHLQGWELLSEVHFKFYVS